MRARATWNITRAGNAIAADVNTGKSSCVRLAEINPNLKIGIIAVVRYFGYSSEPGLLEAGCKASSAKNATHEPTPTNQIQELGRTTSKAIADRRPQEFVKCDGVQESQQLRVQLAPEISIVPASSARTKIDKSVLTISEPKRIRDKAHLPPGT